jgi:CubicO group peptidase (beta-lactamase class C family)
LEQKGKMDLSKTTRSYEARLPTHHTHTVEELLANRGHMGHYDELGLHSHSKSHKTAYSATKKFSSKPLVTDNYLYSTHGYTVAAAAIEAATKKSFCDLVVSEVAAPGNAADLKCENPKKGHSDRSKLYAEATRTLIPRVNLSWKYAGGGMEGSALGLARLGSRLLRGKIISKKRVTAMTTRPDSTSTYAYGWVVGSHNSHSYFQKRGDQDGARSIIRIYPDDDLVIVVMANTRGSSWDLRDPVKAIAKTIY